MKEVKTAWDNTNESQESMGAGEVDHCEKSEVAEGLGWKRCEPLRPAPTRYI
jgi:hypothetical protein